MLPNPLVETVSSEAFDDHVPSCKLLIVNLFDERIIILQVVENWIDVRKEDFYLRIILKEREGEIIEFLDNYFDHQFDRNDISKYLSIEILDDDLVRSLEEMSLEKHGVLNSKPKQIVTEHIMISINGDQSGGLQSTELIINEVLKGIKLDAIETLDIRDFAEFRESSLKFLLNYELNRYLKQKSLDSRKQQAITEKKALNTETNRTGYIDIYVESLNLIIEIKHIHMGYVSFSKQGFMGLEYETLGERVSFQKRENKSPLEELMIIANQVSLSTILKEWSIARLASVYKNQKLPFPIEHVRGYTTQTYYFEPISLVFKEARSQILNYQIDKGNPKRLLLVNIGKRIFYQFVTSEDEQLWNDFKEIN